MNSLCIVHLSDLHLKEESQFGPKSILGKLVEDIKAEIEDQRLGAPFIVISGDLSCQGKQKEFEHVEKFMGSIKSKLDPVGMICCPGNHDLNWDEYGDTCNCDLMQGLIKEPNADSLSNIERRFRTLERKLFGVGMDSYYSFLKKIDQDYNTRCKDCDRPPLYYVKHLDFEKARVNFISLNSAYLFSTNCKDFGYIGKTQIDSAFEEVRENLTIDNKPFNIAVFHHPFESIAPASEVETERFLKSCCGIILNGHVHNLKVYLDLTANLTGENKRRPLISCARCVYDKDEDPYVTPGYSILRIDFNNNKIGSIGIYERKYDKREEGQWVREEQLEYPITVGDFAFSPRPTILNTETAMYKEGINIAQNQTHRNLIIYQRTPSLLLDAKPYGKSEKYKYELDFMDILKTEIRRCVEKQDLSFWYLFDLAKTRKVLQDHQELWEYANDAVDKLKSQEAASNNHFRFEFASFKFLGPLMIGDLGYMVWIGSRNVGKEILVLSSNQTAQTNDMIRELINTLALRQTTTETLKEALGIDNISSYRNKLRS